MTADSSLRSHHPSSYVNIKMRTHVVVSMLPLFTTLASSQMNDLFPDHDPYAMIPPGVPQICPKWFPHDPCFYKETYKTQCYQPYDWDHMRVYELVAVDDHGLVNDTSIGDEVAEMIRFLLPEDIQDKSQNARDIDHAQNQSPPSSNEQNSTTKHGVFPIDGIDNRPPCMSDK
jgi:hypothetical protein